MKEFEKSEKYALLSVSDKKGVAEFAHALDRMGYRIISTGGTAKTLTAAGVEVVPIDQITGNPESFDGRMKTISFGVESGILFDRTNPKHQKEARDLGIRPIDIVVCNLYPFEKTVGDPNAKPEEIVESIDVGGPTMLRSAGKNFENVVAVVDPQDYDKVIETLRRGPLTKEFRKMLAAKVFDHLSFYDAQIAQHLREEKFPQEIALPGRKGLELRYGENPHQVGAVYFEPNSRSPLKDIQRHVGRELSHVNFTDILAGLESVRTFRDESAAVVIKHNSPCGIALGDNPSQALSRAIESDPESAYGGVIVLNQTLDLKAAKIVASFKDSQRGQFDIIAAPVVDQDAVELLNKVRKTTGVYSFGEIPARRSSEMQIKYFDGGHIRQTWDDDIEKGFDNWEIATSLFPSPQQKIQMEVGWKFISRIRSNAVIIIDRALPMTRGVGSGQTSRVRSTKIALEQAGEHAKGAIMISDSFFPFGDSVELAAKHGIAAVLQQGDSVNDQQSIDAANHANIPMLFTHRRAFSH
jgi:phosphoribosylaminoimidazolecarboxamide formyltransferase/IMP cyclohydrolase